MPLGSYRSLSFSSDKANGKNNICGNRIMHCYDAFSMAWHSGTPSRTTGAWAPTWAQGGIAHRSRESSTTIIMCNKWRAECKENSPIVSNYDCTDAFAATERHRLEVQAEEQACPEDAPCAVASVRQQTMTIETSYDTLDIRSITGSQMGYTTAPRDFMNTYNKEVEEWRMGGRGHGEHILFFPNHPVVLGPRFEETAPR
eukprot:198721-Pyramimonas_sp.AAC.1